MTKQDGRICLENVHIEKLDTFQYIRESFLMAPKFGNLATLLVGPKLKLGALDYD